MKREILFRGKNERDGEWEFGGIVHQTDFYGYPCDKYFIIDGTTTNDYDIGNEYKVVSETVGQYTGLTDMDGKKIFEGDIVISSGEYGDGALGEVRIGEYSVMPKEDLYNFGAWIKWFYEPGQTKDMRRQELPYWTKYMKVKVIGNIYDNQELLNAVQTSPVADFRKSTE